MALASTATWELRTAADGGDDGNGGAFDPGAGSSIITFVTSTATSVHPTISSGAYSFQASDQGGWFFQAVSSGGWYAGYFKILSVTAGVATIDATAGNWIRMVVNAQGTIFTVAKENGCGSTASLSGGQGKIDFSQGAAWATITDMAITSTNTRFTSASKPANANPMLVGNFINVISGSGFTVQRRYITSVNVASNFYQCDAGLGTASSTGGTATIGGALLTWGTLGASGVIAGNRVFCKNGTYAMTSATSNVAGGNCLITSGTITNPNTYEGYTTIRGDGTRAVTIKGFTGSSYHLTISSATIAGIIFDANGINMRGIVTNTSTAAINIYNCGFTGFIGLAPVSIQGTNEHCIVRSCSFSFTAATAMEHTNTGSLMASNCEIVSTSSQGFAMLINSSACGIMDSCTISKVNIGFSTNNANGMGKITNCSFYSVGGTTIQAGNSAAYIYVADTIFEACGTVCSFNGPVIGCVFFNNTTNFNTTTGLYERASIYLSASPFNGAASGDFSLNNTAGAGALCRAATPTGFTTSTSYRDKGAIQTAAGGGGGSAQTAVASFF